MIRPAIAPALQGVDTAIGGLDVAARRPAIRDQDRRPWPQARYRGPRPFQLEVAPVGTSAGAPRDRLGALLAVWRAAAPPPHGGRREPPPGFVIIHRSLTQNFFAPEKPKIFSAFYN